DPEMLRLLARMVRSLSARYVVREAHGGREALELIEADRPDLVLADLIMPDLGGDELVRRIRTNPAHRDVSMVLITGQGPFEHALVAESLTFTRKGGLSVAELVRCLGPSLQALQPPPTDSLRARPGAPLA
ncbi:MAG TPA: response regulator, partial [Chloroflexota bacterium]|nr:response regulator [Chloroflexota bacterium]